MPNDTPNTPQIEVIAAVNEHVADMAQQGRFPDGSFCRWCDNCEIGSPEDSWTEGACPECGSRGGA